MKTLMSLVLSSCFVINICVAQDCDSKETCDKCIQELNCFWCTSPKSGSSHCLLRSKLNSCEDADTEDPEKPQFNISEAKALTESEQISPQRVHLKLRRNKKYEIRFQYRQSANYPVDLYYLMDISHSMEKSKDTLASLGGKLADEMKRKTNNFRIGFGSFVDKLAMPFVNTHPDYIKRPCSGCTSPYSFKNHISLINNASLFAEKVKETRMSGNLDTPEGGLDAIMQAIVCKQEIGWRPNARHLLVMSTDAVSHIAGDGKLGGVIEPNDATCHMVDNNYTHGLVYDYPSVSQINYVARENNINIIFAIVLENNKNPDHLKDHYQAMSNIIENSKTGSLNSKSDDVVKFISDIYDQIRDSVKITSDAKKDVNVTIDSSHSGCRSGDCTGIKLGQIIDFTATIEPLICHKDPRLNKKVIKIKPESLEDQLVVELEVLCDCACADQKKTSHSECNFEGDLECGICRCKEGKFGANCQCNWNESKGEDPSLCVKPGGKNDTCSGQGKCKCGKCECKTRPDPSELIYGKYCECDNFSCPQKCSGRGTCNCGKCECETGWSGRGCDCNNDQSQCVPPDEKQLCSGHGNCRCGQCVCIDDGDIRYSGKYCQDCTNCPAQRCEELKPCVECQAYQSGPYANSTDCAENCTIFTTKIVKKLDEEQREGIKRCRVVVEENCAIIFEYSYDENKNLVVAAEELKICSNLPPLLPYILGVIGSVLLIGIITLTIWKIVTTVHDKSEYAQFLEERNKTKWSTGENPLYKPGTSHFQNPAYKRASCRFSVPSSTKKPDVDDNQGKTEL